MSVEGPIDLVQQVRAHLESLQAAGVLLLPKCGPIAIPQLRLVPAPSENATPRLVAVTESEPVADPLESRRRALDVLRDEVAKCDKCSELFSRRVQTVFGTGPLDAEVAFVGVAPGSAEEAQGEPFAGKGGEILTRMINGCGFTRPEVYLLNAIKCRPPKNRAPTGAECLNCRDFFRQQFDLVKPKHVVALGEFVSRALSGKNATLAELRGTVHQYRGVPLICTHHPDDIERDTTGRLRRETGFDLKLLLETMGRDVPGAK